MNDVERDLRELFERKAGSVGGVAPKLPETVRKRGRRRQIGTTVVGAFTVVAVAVVSFAGLRAIDRGEPDGVIPAHDPWAGYDVFERTATIGNLTVTSPSDWYLVDQWWIGASTITSVSGTESCAIGPDEQEQTCETVESSTKPVRVPQGLPVFQLSNVDPGLGMPRCGQRLAAGEAVLYVAVDNDMMAAGGMAPPWPVRPEDRSSGACGAGMYASFSAGQVSYLAWMGFGEGIDGEDRGELMAAFEALHVGDGTLEPPRSPGPAYVIAGGENAAGPWTLEARASPPGALSSNVELTLVGAEGGSVVEGFGVPAVPIEQAGGDPTFGAVTKHADSVELRSDGVVEPARIVPVPPSLGSGFDLFFGSHEGDVVADAVALDADGHPLGGSYVVPPLAVTDDGNFVIARLDAFGSTWELSAPRDGNGCSLRRTPSGSDGVGGSCEVSTMSTGGRNGYAFMYGTLPDAADTAQVVAADGATYPCGVLTTGPSGRRYFVIALEGAGPGEFQVLRADGTVIERRELSWADPRA